MNSTPRRGPGGFPATPQQPSRSPRSPDTAASTPASTPARPNVRSSPLPDVPRSTAPVAAGPLIPTDILDAAQQRFYVVAFYAALWAWRLYDFYGLAIEEDESLALCLKWVFLDMCFIFGVPLLEIPWMEWSNAAAFLLFVAHAALDGMLMFRVGIPFQAWLVSLAGFLWDSELAISERSVKPGSILHNASLILGKQIINILPEGSAILNPDQEPFCLNSSVTHVDVPIRVNQTEPVEMLLLRIDIDNNHTETITIRKGELKNMLKKARKVAKRTEPTDPLTLRYTIKKPGIYLLDKVTDQSKLEVRPRASSLVVAKCPQAHVKPTGDHRCRNDLSNVTLEVEGVPPLHVKYRLSVDDKPHGASDLQNLQPDEYSSPLSRHTSQALIKKEKLDFSWARAHTVSVPLNEVLLSGGKWVYAVEEVQDGLGNLVSFLSTDEEDRPKVKPPGLQRSFRVHERPKAALRNCGPQRPLQAPKGDVVRLPVEYSSTGKRPIDAAHTISYLFTHEADIVAEGYHSPNAELQTKTMRSGREQPLIAAPGLYTIKSISTDFCEGEVLEPTSCLLQNPPEPELSLSSEDIVDKCAGNPIGLRVGLDFIGTPPFYISYTEQRSNRKPIHHPVKQFGSLRGTLDLTPTEAGHYTYTFNTISDAVYKKQRSLQNLVLQQDVKPPASAHFVEGKMPKQVCIEDSVDFDVALQGEGPWKLEYEVVHNGKRSRHVVNVEEEHFTIKTQKLKSGGEYSVALASVTDKMGCRVLLEDEEVKVQVRHERPKAYFGHIDGKQSVLSLEGKMVELPLRLTGTKPWTLEYQNLESHTVHKVELRSANSFLNVKDQGTYQLLSVRDSVCPGLVEDGVKQFNVDWIPRPQITIVESDRIIFDDGTYLRDAICEGDEDAFDVSLTGNGPYDVSYRQEYKDSKGKTVSVSEKDLRTHNSIAAIRADTSKAGVYEYTFTKLADSRYDHSKKHFSPLTVRQTVNPRPNARFNNPGKTYSYCSLATDGEEVIPMTLEGVPPFHLEIEIKHHGTPQAEISTHRDIPSNKYDLRIEHRKLHLGHSAISIRKVRDARGCSFKPPPGGPRVQISVHDAPTATPLEDRTDFCVGDRLSFALSGQVPFTVYYTFNEVEKKASNSGTTFRRLAELPGTFTITGLRDSASECLANLELTKHIHPIPTVRLSGGKVTEVDIHEGGGTNLEFDFTGTPPFEFTYTRSTNEKRGKKSRVLEMRTEVSHEYKMLIPVQEEGTYEVVSIKDKWCSFERPGEGLAARGGQKLLTY